MDYKFDDEIKELTEEDRKVNKLPLIIVIILSIIVGLLVFVISNAILGPKKVKETPKIDTQVELNDENVEILYRYVTFRDKEFYTSKFVKEQSVTFDKFSDEEKLLLAFQFAKDSDFSSTDKKDIYFISDDKVNSYVKRFFGENATYENVEKLTVPLSFSIDKLNMADISYDSEKGGYNVSFTTYKKDYLDIANGSVYEYYRELSSATKKSDGTLILNEKVIYTTVEEENKIYRVNIYKDYSHNNLIETRQNLSLEDLKENPVTIDKYREKAATISYTFKLNSDRTYYFYSSEIN